MCICISCICVCTCMHVSKYSLSVHTYVSCFGFLCSHFCMFKGKKGNVTAKTIFRFTGGFFLVARRFRICVAVIWICSMLLSHARTHTLSSTLTFTHFRGRAAILSLWVVGQVWPLPLRVRTRGMQGVVVASPEGGWWLPSPVTRSWRRTRLFGQASFSMASLASLPTENELFAFLFV